jgi:ankyrin repeat protein
MKKFKVITSLAIFLSILVVIIFQSLALAGSLQDAARSGNIEQIKNLLSNGIKVDAKDEKYGATALHWAAVKGHKDIAKLLLTKSANVNMKNTGGDMPLHLAVAFCHKEVAEILITYGADVNETRKEGSSPLHTAVERCSKTMVEFLISKGANINAQVKYGQMRGQTPLYRAAGKNLQSMAALLVSKNANPNISNKDGDTPLHVAAAHGYKNLVELLIAKGADVNAKSNDGTTPFDFAIQQDHNDVAHLLSAAKSTNTVEFESYADRFFSIIYPKNWKMLSKREIKMISENMEGDAPSFSVVDTEGSSLSVIVTDAPKEVIEKYEKQPKNALKKQYALFVGDKMPKGFKRQSEAFLSNEGQTALETVFRMPPMNGIIFAQKHVCFVIGEKAFLISSTAKSDRFSEKDRKYFVHMIGSFKGNDGSSNKSKSKYSQTELEQNNKFDELVLGMQSEKAAALLGVGCHSEVNEFYKPKGVALVIQCKNLKLDFLHNRLYEITYQSDFDLSTPFAPFDENKYNMPVDVQRIIRWGIGVPEFLKTLDRWVEILRKDGLNLVLRNDEYISQNKDRQLKVEQLGKDEVLMEKLHPSRHEYWVHFGPIGRYSSLPRVLWSFSFDPQSLGLSKIAARDRDEEGFVSIE